MRKFLASALLATLATGAFAEGSGVADTAGPNLVLELGGQVSGKVVIDLLPDVAPKHVERLVQLARDGAYDGVIFHRVIEGFMAQTGDVQFGKHGADNAMAGIGGSSYPDLPLEASNRSFQRGMVGAARGPDPDSANSQFFIMTDPATLLDGQYTLFGHVIEGLELVDQIKKGSPYADGRVLEDPDYIVSVTVVE
jgi:peptidylprolyl isomerase